MTDAIIWADKLPDIIKKWILILPMLLAVIGSGAGWYQYSDKQDAIIKAEAEKNKAIHEVATAFQNAMVEKTITPKIIVRKSSCGKCLKKVETLKLEVNKLKRWH